MLATDLLETRVVLWRDSEGVLHAWEDRCPHRGTRLSMGSLQDDALTCPTTAGALAEGRCITSRPCRKRR
jgi:phenylpropionate dioxygenase-like ring-hydroxylating dioxygenase large terminal subunit